MLSTIKAFWRQPARRYRHFQLMYTVLTLNFTIPALIYTFSPQTAMDQFLQINTLLGGDPYTFPEAASRVWRYLAAANVMTLGLSCLLLQLDLRRFFPVLLPLTFMKAYAAACWLAGWLFAPGYRFFLAAALLDAVTCWAFVWFATRARRAIEQVDPAQLVPRPLGERWGRR
ncbi:MAG: hypothetical protein FJ125_09715 [Deltaproteobacteria bacterium]|nr:hypothetical protein [Deltaproteobacteria bacterium]